MEDMVEDSSFHEILDVVDRPAQQGPNAAHGWHGGGRGYIHGRVWTQRRGRGRGHAQGRGGQNIAAQFEIGDLPPRFRRQAEAHS